MGTQDFPQDIPNHEILMNAKGLVTNINLHNLIVVISATPKRHFPSGHMPAVLANFLLS